MLETLKVISQVFLTICGFLALMLAGAIIVSVGSVIVTGFVIWVLIKEYFKPIDDLDND